MKIKNVLLTLIVLALFACSSDDLTNNLQDINSEIQLENPTNALSNSISTPQIQNNAIESSFGNDDGGLLIGLGGVNYGNCPEFMAPFRDNPSQQTGQLLDIRYDPSTPLDEINCIRKSFFEQFCYLRMFAYDPGDPYHDVWIEVENLTGCFRPNIKIDNFPFQNDVPPTSTGGVSDKTAVEKASDEDHRFCARKPRNSSDCN